MSLEALNELVVFTATQSWLVLQKIVLIKLVCLPFEYLWPISPRTSGKWFSKEGLTDVLYWHQLLFWAHVPIFVAANAVTWLMWGESTWFPTLATLWWPIQVFLAVVAFDAITYWRHRLTHHVPFLWPIHAVHHTAEQIDFLTTSRLHIFEIVLGSILNAVVFRFGMTEDAVATGFAVYLYWNYFVHVNVRFRWPGPLKYVFNSPFVHHWHHAIDDDARDHNFGVVFAWNDWLFGTMYYPEHWPSKFGIDFPNDEAVDHNIVRHTVYPFRLWLHKLGIAG